MYSFKKSLVTLIGLLTLVGVVAAITPFRGYSQQSPQAATAVQDVRVVNTASVPVQSKIINTTTAPVLAKIVNPTTAPLPVNGTVSARQLGVWNVGLTGTPAVTVRNEETTPVPVHIVSDAPREPFQYTFPLSFPTNGNIFDASFFVPANKRLVIEFASGQGYMQAGQKLVSASITTKANANDPSSDSHYLVPVFLGPSFNGTSDFFGASQQMRVYAGPGTEVIAKIVRNGNASSGLGEFNITISGFLENVP